MPETSFRNFLWKPPNLNYTFHSDIGVVVDIGKLLSQLERSEQARFDADSRLTATNKILSNIRETEGKQQAIKEKLQVNHRTY